MAKKITKIEGLGEEGKDLLGTMNELLKKVGSVEKVMGVIQQAGQNYTRSLQQSSSELEKIARKIEEGVDGYSDLSNKIRNIEDANKDILKTFRTQEFALKQNLKIEEAEAILARQDLTLQMIKNGLSLEERDIILAQFDELQKNLKIQKHQQEAAERLKKIDHEREELMESINEKAHIFKQALTDGKVLMALTVAGAMKLGEAFSEAYKELKEEGLSVTQAAHESMTSFTDSMSTGFLVSAKSIREARKAIYETGGSLHDAEEAGVAAADMATKFGGSAAAAGKALGNLQKLPGLTKDAAKNTAEFGAKLSIAAGMAGDTVTKEMANNMEAVALAGAKNVESLQKAVINSQKMGVEFSKIASASDKLLNFESSINDQLEASVLLGREINLDKAREAALTGDYLTVQKEILNAVGSEAEFNKMNVMQKQKLAQAMGVSVGDMAKMVSGQAEQTDLAKEAAAAQGDQVASQSKLKGFLMENAGTAAGMLGSLIMMIPQIRMMQMMSKMSGGSGGVFGSLFGKGGGGTPTLPPKTEQLGGGAKAGGGMKGLAQGLKSMAGGKVTQGIGNLALFGLAAIPALAGIPFMVAVSLGGVATGLGLSGLAEGLKGKGMGAALVALGVTNTMSFGLAGLVGLLALPFMVGIAMFGHLAGLGLRGLAGGLKAMANPAVAIGAGILAVVLLSAGASMLMFGIGIGVAAAGMSLLVTSLKDVPFENLAILPMALMGIGAGLGVMAVAGLAALPIIAALTALAIVAPALVGLGVAMGGMFGGGGEEGDKMDELIGEIRELRVIVAAGKDINLDSKKIGEAMNLGGFNQTRIR